MEHTKERKTESTVENQTDFRTESRSEYHKRKREDKKREKRRGRKRVILIAIMFVILAGVLCGTVIAATISTPQDTVKIASANVEYVKTTVQSTMKDKLTDLSELLRNLQRPGESSMNMEDDNNDTSHQMQNEMSEGTEDKLIQSEPQSTTESAVSLITPDNPYGIDPSKPMVALTFDDGPSKYTWPIVSALAKHNARATFFLVGNRVATHEAAIDFLLENHQEVASHSFSHANLAKLTEEEVLAQIQKVDTALQTQHDYTPALFRVPYGERDEQVLQIMREQNKPVIGWSVDPRDWEVQDKETIVKHVLSRVKDGDIILMHDLYKPTADAVAELIPALQERGYQLVTVSELLQFKGIAITPGTYYYASWKWQ